MKDPRAIAFGSRLKAIRGVRGMTQQKVAVVVGVNVSQVSHWETGEQTCPLIHQMRLCDALGCTLRELQGRDVYKHQQRLNGASFSGPLRDTKNTTGIMIAFNVSDEGSKIVTSVPTTARGKATKIDTKDRQPTVTLVSGNGSAEILVNASGALETTVHHGTVADGEDFEVSTYEISADADLDPSEDRAITETVVVTTTRSEASSLNSTVGEEIPDA